MSKKRNETLSVFKCISIYAVILAHVPFPGQFGRALCALAKFSVVVFFLSSGYFSWEKSGTALKRSAGKTGSLLIKVVLFHLAVGCFNAVREGTSAVDFLLERFHPLYIKETLLYQVLSLPYSWHLWFLTSLLVVYILWWAMTAWLERRGGRVPYGALGVLAVVLLGINIALGEGRALIGLTPLPNLQLRNAWLDAFPCFALGSLLREKEAALLPRLKLPLLWGGTAACVVLNLWEFSRVDVVDVFLGTTVLAVLLMLIAMKHPQAPRNLLIRWACYCGDRLTFYIYVIHVPMYCLMKFNGGAVLGPEGLLSHRWLTPVAIALLSTLLAVCFDRLAQLRPKGVKGARQ